MSNIAETVKKQTDRILRQRALNRTEGVVVSGIVSGGSPPVITNPGPDLDAHKVSSDHDGRYYTETELDAGQLDTRYYTEAEVDALLASMVSNVDLLTNGDTSDPQLLFDSNADVIWVEV